MTRSVVPPRALLNWPEAVVITVVVLVVTVLFLSGTKPVTAVFVTGSAGLIGALVARAATTAKLA